MGKTKLSIVSESRPIAIYNSNKKELIGLFSEIMLACKYLRPTDPRASYDNVYQALQRKGGIFKTIFNFKVNIRYATESQLDELKDNDVIIKNGYPEMEFNKKTGYTTTRLEMYNKVCRNAKN